MIGMPFRFEGKGVLEAVVAAAAKAAEGEAEQKWKEGISGEPTSVLDTRRSPSPPTSSSTLSSSLGGGGGGDSAIGVAAVHQKWEAAAEGGGGSGRKDHEWGLEPIPAGLEIGGGGGGGGAAEDCWESLLTASGGSSPGHDPAYLRYFFQEMEAHPQQQYLLSLAGSSAVHDFDVAGGGAGFGGLVEPGFGFEPPPAAVAPPPINNPPLSGFPMMNAAAKFPNNPVVFPPLQIPPGMFFQGGLAAAVEEKPPPPLFMNPQQVHPCQNPAFFHPFPCTSQEQFALPPPPKRHHVMDPPPLPQQQLPQDVFLRRKPQEAPQRPAMKPKAAMATVGVGGGTIDENQLHQQQQIVVNQLYKAAELVETGNSPSARGILARLNQQLSFSSNINHHHHLGKPLLRAALLFKDALLRLIDSPSPKDAFSSSAASLTPMEVFLKISADKAFSEISPVTQFSTFTANQVILDELSGSYRIHVLDFDVGIGGQWASFLQELSLRRTNSVMSLRITAFASPSSSHPLELALTKESLAHFAGDLGIPFEFNAVNLDSFTPATLGVSPDEVVVVNLPAGPSVGPLILRFVKQLRPRIVVSVDHGSVGGGGGSGGGGEFPFSHHFLHALQSNVALLDSIHAAGADPEAVHRIEAFLVRQRIEAAVTAAAGGRRLGDGQQQQQLHWRSQFASAGFVPVALSNFAEAQAECLVKRVQVRGFHVEKPNASSLVLCWQRAELVSFSAWRC